MVCGEVLRSLREYSVWWDSSMWVVCVVWCVVNSVCGEVLRSLEEYGGLW